MPPVDAAIAFSILFLGPEVVRRLNVLTDPVKAKLGPDLDYWESPENSRVK